MTDRINPGATQIELDLVKDFEDNLSGWVRNSFIFFVAGIGLHVFTKEGHAFALIAFALTIYLLIVTLYEYWQERQYINDLGLNIPKRLDLIAIALITAALLTMWILYTLIIELTSGQKTVTATELKAVLNAETTDLP